MTIRRFYVRGHGGQADQPLPPSEESSVDVITIGQFGSTMSDEVADWVLYEHLTDGQVAQSIADEDIIYWTRAQRDEWYEDQNLEFSTPALNRENFSTISYNLTLYGDSEVGQCGLCFWEPTNAELVWVVQLAHGQTMTLADMAHQIDEMLQVGDIAQLYWSACMSADYFIGSNKKVSFNPQNQQ